MRLVEVGKTFRMGEVPVEVLRHISLDVCRGELLVMVGPSGSGKTTLLNIMGGLDTPTVGHVWYGEQDLTAANPRELTRYRRNSVGFVFQFCHLVLNLTAPRERAGGHRVDRRELTRGMPGLNLWARAWPAPWPGGSGY